MILTLVLIVPMLGTLLMARLIFMATLLMFLLIFLVFFVALVALLLLAATLLATLLLVALLLVVTHMISLHGWDRKTGRAHNRSDVLAKELLNPFISTGALAI